MQKTDSKKTQKVSKSAKTDVKTNKFAPNEEERIKSVIASVVDDYNERKEERRPYENNFCLCMNFVLGNQHSYVLDSGEIAEDERMFAWESRDTFNHIAPIVETRLAKLARVRPKMHVRPVSNDDEDVLTARLSSMLLDSSAIKTRLDEVVSEATLWSEVCGTAFYKICWNPDAGCVVGETEDGQDIPSGDIDVSVCSPFEIFPSSSATNSIETEKSLIHAYAADVDDIFRTYGERVESEEVDVFNLSSKRLFGGVLGTNEYSKLIKSKKKHSALVIERYSAPSDEYENGRLEIVCGGKLLFEGDLPYVSPCGKRYFPFVRQISLSSIGSFWGTSVVERCIPLQRAYNSIKNRKHELLTRLAAGVLVVEDGSIDVDALEEDGLSPGKLLVYRNGSTPPRFMDEGDIPNEFTLEENRILDEFVTLSGVSEFSRSSVAPSNVSSGVALGLLVEQDDTRLSQTADYIRFAVRGIAKQILSLYKQFGTNSKIVEIAGKNGEVECKIFETSHITSDDVCLDSENEMNESPSSRKAMVLDLLKYGLLNGENGKMSERVRGKVLEALGFGNWEAVTDLSSLQLKRARSENYGEEKLEILAIDDHRLHIDEHTKWVLENMDSKRRDEMIEHIKGHKMMLEV